MRKVVLFTRKQYPRARPDMAIRVWGLGDFYLDMFTKVV
jgi:hypothetical protein